MSKTKQKSKSDKEAVEKEVQNCHNCFLETKDLLQDLKNKLFSDDGNSNDNGQSDN